MDTALSTVHQAPMPLFMAAAQTAQPTVNHAPAPTAPHAKKIVQITSTLIQLP
jgi:hypothetical protein